MKFSISVSELSKALMRVQGIVEKKTTMPILANALIRADDDGRIGISATDLEIGLTAEYSGQVETSGSVTLGARALYDIVRSLPEAEVSLERKDNQWVEIKCGRVKYRVVGMAAEGFPALPEISSASFFSVDPKLFKRMIERTLYAVSTDESRYNLTGVYCEPAKGSEKGLKMVATDGHRLSVVEESTSQQPLMKQGVIIPRKGLTELKKLLDEGEETGELAFEENSAVFKKGSLVLTMRLVDGRFPDYQQVIPDSSTRRVELDRRELQSALKRTSLLSPDKAQGVRLDLDKGSLALMANNPDLGEAREELGVNYDGEPLKIGFNFRYLMDVLSAMDEERVSLELTDELSPGIVRGVGSERYTAVIMPMRI